MLTNNNQVSGKRLGRPKGTVKRNEDVYRLIVLLPEDEKEWVRNAAKSRGISMSDFVADLINERCDYEEKLKTKAEKKK